MTPITKLKGAGSKVAEKFKKIGIQSVEDLLFHFPIRYQDRTHIRSIRELSAGDEALVEGVITSVQIVYRGRRQMLVYINDNSGLLQLRFFHFSTAQRNYLKEGRRLSCYGEVRVTRQVAEMIHPEYAFVDSHTVQQQKAYVPIYSTTEGLHQLSLRKFTDYALEWLSTDDNQLEELLPESVIIDSTQQFSLKEAVHYIHRPPLDADIDLLCDGQHPVQKRLVFEEMLAHSLSLKRLRKETKQQKALAISKKGELFSRLEQNLPFSLTGAQQKVIGSLFQDLCQSSPMMRLVQGDVGSGKTLVAVAAMLMMVEEGWQAGLMVPTEILAEQHYRNLCTWLEPLGITVCLLTGKQKAAQSRINLRQVRTGEAKVIVGTHALFQSRVEFDCLAIIVVDEQHRFGVHQRLALKQKGEVGDYQPHQLIMTATPIPRSLAMTMYADLDYSVIDEMPPGRLPVKTVVMEDARRHEIIERTKQSCLQGQQAYWVCALIEESEVLQCRTAEETHELLKKEMPELTTGLIHGRMKSEEKTDAVERFTRGETQLLVATTVIEVGVDIPNAGLMVIENAERFGLAQLHQLRGRIGRGTEQAYCLLLYHPPLSLNAKRRLEIMRRSSNGFDIAYEDMKIRGPGEVLGTRQTGEMRFRIADLVRDASELEKVLQVSEKVLYENPELSNKLIERWLGEMMRYAEV